MPKSLIFFATAVLFFTGCAPYEVLWQSENIHVELSNDPSVRKVVHNDQTLYYKVDGGYAYLDEHVILGPVDENGVLLEYLEPLGNSRSQCIFWIFCKDFRWSEGVVPYTLNSDLSAWQVQQVLRAIDSIHATTRIRLVPREEGHRDYIEFQAGKSQNSCSSYLGRKGGRQTIQLGKNSCYASAVEHEIGHALGLIHEHQRCDRNKHVRIHWGQMNPSYIFNFINLCFMGEDQGEYDITSNMHYGPYAFSRKGQPTISLVAGGLPTPSPYFSSGDLAAIESLYALEIEKR